MVAALEIALAVGLLAVAAAFLATVFHRETERLLVVLAVVLVVLAAASGILLAVGAAIDRWDLTELAIVAGGFLAAAAGAAGALGLSRGLNEVRSIEDSGARMRDQLDASLDAHVQLRIRELEHTLARERAETAHQLAEQERRLREDRRTAVAEQLDVARAELHTLRRRDAAAARAAAVELERRPRACAAAAQGPPGGADPQAG